MKEIFKSNGGTMINQKELIILGTTVAIIGAAFAFGYHKGTVNQIEKFTEKKQQLQNKVTNLETDLNVKAAKILALQIEKEGLIDDLEQAALNAEGASAPGISSTGGLYRLERRWSKDSETP
jgi:hypothetical protein